MERLTKRISNGKIGYALLAPGECVDVIDLLHVWGDRLADYEDTMPLEQAQELAQAEKDGRLVVLPCKVGDTVYRIIMRKDGHGHIASATVSGLHMGDTERSRRYKKGREYIVLKVDGNFCAHIDVKQIGKTVFLTREEAEAALKKREDG